MKEGRIVCDVCPHACVLSQGQRGLCRARIAEGHATIPENYGRLTSIAVDPIEKKPLARFLPGTHVLSVGSYGCSLRCPFCQNWTISQAGAGDVSWREVAPCRLVEAACALRDEDPLLSGIAYTYNEPLVGWEYVRDCAALAHKAGLANVLVSNGCAEAWVIQELAPLIDAANIDLKGPDQRFYDECAGSFDAVRHAIEIFAAAPACHLEITYLVVPGMNDTEQDMEKAASWLAELPAAGDGIVLHVTRFFPRWRMQDRAPTPIDTVTRLVDVAKHHLPDVVAGNI